MKARRKLKPIVAGAVLAGGVAMVGSGLGSGVAQAYPMCTPNVASNIWDGPNPPPLAGH
jgi:hypothetical protein